MFDKLDFILEKYEELSRKVSDPDVIARQKEWQRLMKEMSDLEPIVKEYTAYKKAKEELEEAKEILELEDDEELREMAREELKSNEAAIEQFTENLRFCCCQRILTTTRT